MSIIGIGAGIQLINLFLMLFFIGAWIYSFVLFVKLARRGIKALDLYIGEKRSA